MDEIWPEYLQALLQFFNLMLNIFLDGGKFMKAIADVNVHERLGLAYEVRNQVLSTALLSRLYTRSKKGKPGNSNPKIRGSKPLLNDGHGLQPLNGKLMILCHDSLQTYFLFVIRCSRLRADPHLKGS